MFTMDSEGAPRNIEVRPALGAGFAGCGSGAPAKALPAVGSPWRTRFGVTTFEDVVGPVDGAFKGTPFPGQKEISQVEVLTTQLGASGGKADEETKKALAEAAAKEAAEMEGKKSWWEKLQGYTFPIMLFFVIQRLFGDLGGGGEEGGKKKEGAAAAAARRG